MDLRAAGLSCLRVLGVEGCSRHGLGFRVRSPDVRGLGAFRGRGLYGFRGFRGLGVFVGV